MNIYLVTAGFDWEGSSLKKSFLSLPDASAYIASQLGKTGYDTYSIFVLDTTINGGEPVFVLEVDNPFDYQPAPFTTRYRIYDIQYDFEKTDGIDINSEVPDLPRELTYDMNDVDYAGEGSVEGVLSDYISDTTGFCHNGFKYERLDK